MPSIFVSLALGAIQLQPQRVATAFASNETKAWFARLSHVGEHTLLSVNRGGDGKPCPRPGHPQPCAQTLEVFSNLTVSGAALEHRGEGESFIWWFEMNASTSVKVGFKLQPNGTNATANAGLYDTSTLEHVGGAVVRMAGFPAPLISLATSGTVLVRPQGGSGPRFIASTYGSTSPQVTGCTARGPPHACDAVFFVASDDGLEWTYRGRADFEPALMVADEEGPCEPAIVRINSTTLLTVFRVNARVNCYQRYSHDDGATWSPPRRMAAWAVDPPLRLLSNGVLLLSSGRPGLVLWASEDGGETWERLSLAGAHNSLVADAAWHFAPAVVNASCDYPYSCDQQASPPQSTAYTGLVEVEGDGAADTAHVIAAYDRVANGWSYPPGPWGAADAVFLMALTARRTGAARAPTPSAPLCREPANGSAPGALHNLSGWKVQLPEECGTGHVCEKEGAALSSFHNAHFFSTADGEVTFCSPVDGATTPHSEYPRSELEELSRWGVGPAATGRHVLSASVRVLALDQTARVPSTIIGQVHGNSSAPFAQLLKLRYVTRSNLQLTVS